MELSLGLSDILSVSFLTAALLSLVGYLSKNLFTAALKAEYSKALEKFKNELEWELVQREEKLKWETVKRTNAAAVADFIALWVANRYYEIEDEGKHQLEIQKKYWEIAFWLEPKALKELNKALTHSDDGLALKQALIDVRKMILNDQGDPIEVDDFVHWDLPQGNRNS